MASVSSSLTHRLQALADSYKQTLNLIQELQRFPSGALFTADPNPDEKRLEVTNDIHQSLKEQEDSLEFLKQEVQDADDDNSNRRDTRLLRSSKNNNNYNNTNRSEERERNAATLTRLNEDVKSARVAFRRAQLQAKRNADTTKRKEREELFADRLHSPDQTSSISSSLTRKEGSKKLTQDEIALNAAEDVTRSLRRAHELLAGNLQQSQFAQQTLEESQEALKGLADSYGGTTDLLKSSRGLVGQLVRSQKSDTWFLMSSLYLLMFTIAWLIFRRLLYGPMWWLVWQPLKLMWYVTFTSLGAVGLAGGGGGQSKPDSISLAPRDIPTNSPEVVFKHMPLPGKGGGWGAAASSQPAAATSIPETPDMVDAVGKMAEAAAAGEQVVPTLQERDPEESPVNHKKRMHEEVQQQEQQILRDEL